MKKIPILYSLLMMFMLCTVHRTLQPVPQQSSLPEPSVDTVELDSTEQVMASDTVSTLTVDQWPGQQCLLLEKPLLFRKLGYEMYRCEEMASCLSPLDTAYDLASRRIRYDLFINDTLDIIKVRKEADEWVVTFNDKRFSMPLYAKTYKGAIKDIVMLADLDAASKRWLGKTIYSRKGVLSTAASNGVMSSIKVSKRDSLHVVAVKSGFTPLPVNPIWLMVQTRDSTKGFIPVRISWSNTMGDQVLEGTPWDDDVFEKNPLHVFSWDQAIWELVDNHRIVVDMTTEQVLFSWGRPLKKVEKVINNSKAECWIYSAQELYFSQNKLIAINDIIGR